MSHRKSHLTNALFMSLREDFQFSFPTFIFHPFLSLLPAVVVSLDLGFHFLFHFPTHLPLPVRFTLDLTFPFFLCLSCPRPSPVCSRVPFHESSSSLVPLPIFHIQSSHPVLLCLVFLPSHSSACLCSLTFFYISHLPAHFSSLSCVAQIVSI